MEVSPTYLSYSEEVTTMGKTYLSESELRQFPTIADLTKQMGEWDPNIWGLCVNEGSGAVAFIPCFHEGWELWHSLEEIYEGAHVMYGENYNPEHVRFMYFFANLTRHNNQRPVLEYHFLEMEEGDGTMFCSNPILFEMRN